jgi:tetratricopeptide (TPR) repeat protein
MPRQVRAAALLAAGAGLLLPLLAALPQSGADNLFAAAEGHLRTGDVEEARAAYRELIVTYPRSSHPDTVWRAAARVRLGDLLWRNGNWRLAGAEYVDVVEFEPPSRWTARATLKLAYVALAEKDWAGAIELLQGVLDAPEAAADVDAAAAAQRALALADRFYTRGATGTAPYSTARIANMGAEIDRPVAIAVSSDGQILMVDEGVPAVFLKDPERDAASRLTYNVHSRPWWGVDGLPYLPTRKAGVIALGGSHLGFMSNDGGRSMPLKDLQAGVRTPDGSWFLLDADPRRVLKFDADGTYRGLATTAREQPIDVAIDGVGRLYVLEREGSRVLRFDASGEREGIVIATQWQRPEALAVDRLGNSYIIDRGARTIDIFSSEGARIHRLGPTLPGNIELRAPRDIAVDDSGRIYVADRSARVVVVIE